MKTLKPSEAVAAARLIEERERPNTEARKRASYYKPGGVREFPAPGPEAAEVAARTVGLSVTTYARGKRIVDAARTDPARFGDLLVRLDRTGNFTGTANELSRRLRGGGEAATAEADRREARRADRQLQAGIWQLVRVALENLSSLPDAREVAVIVRAVSRDRGFMHRKLAHSLKWLEEFSNVWNDNESTRTAETRHRNRQPHP